jgi:hypothetical protein
LYTVDPGDIAGSKLNVRFVMREVRDSSAFSSVNMDKMSDTTRLEYLRQQSEAVRELDEAHGDDEDAAAQERQGAADGSACTSG